MSMERCIYQIKFFDGQSLLSSAFVSGDSGGRVSAMVKAMISLAERGFKSHIEPSSRISIELIPDDVADMLIEAASKGDEKSLVAFVKESVDGMPMPLGSAVSVKGRGRGVVTATCIHGGTKFYMVDFKDGSSSEFRIGELRKVKKDGVLK